MKLVFIFFALCGTLATAFPQNDKAMEHYEDITLEHVRSIHGSRWRRSAIDNLPEEIHFKFPTKKTNVLLRLKRSDVDINLPVYVVRSNRAERLDLPNITNAAVYTDNNAAASVVVTDNMQEYSVEGTVVIGNTEYYITPDNTKVKSSGKGIGHRLKRLRKKITYNDDGIERKATRKQKKRKSKFLSEKRRKMNRNGRKSRSKRSVDEHKVETYLIADFSVYKKFLEMTPDDTMAKINIRQYYAFLLNSIDIRYATVQEVDEEFSIRVVATGLLIFDTPVSSGITENTKNGDDIVDVISAMNLMQSWVQVQSFNEYIPQSDHYMLFTEHDIAVGESVAVVGVAYVGATCTDYSISIIEEFFGGQTGAIAAHELGHSLGAGHDETEAGSCLDSDNYIMASYSSFPEEVEKASRPWTFSTCSVGAFKRYMSSVSCTKTTDARDFIGSSQDAAGQVLDGDRQCQMAFGAKSVLCRPLHIIRGYDTMCPAMYCTLPDKPGYCGKTVPQEETSCGDGKWCVTGLCEASPRAPRKYAKCPQGDDPTYNCDARRCTNGYSESEKNTYCCETCAISAGVELGTVSPETRPPTTVIATTSLKTTTTSSPTTTTTQPTTTTTQPTTTTKQPTTTTKQPTTTTTQPTTTTTQPTTTTKQPTTTTKQPTTTTTQPTTTTTQPTTTTKQPTTTTKQPTTTTMESTTSTTAFKQPTTEELPVDDEKSGGINEEITTMTPSEELPIDDGNTGGINEEMTTMTPTEELPVDDGNTGGINEEMTTMTPTEDLPVDDGNAGGINEETTTMKPKRKNRRKNKNTRRFKNKRKNKRQRFRNRCSSLKCLCRKNPSRWYCQYFY